MSKRLSSNQSNTLLNYFQSPNTPKRNVDKSASNTPVTPKTEKQNKFEDSDNETLKCRTKKRRLAIVDSDSGSDSDSVKQQKKKANLDTSSPDDPTFQVKHEDKSEDDSESSGSETESKSLKSHNKENKNLKRKLIKPQNETQSPKVALKSFKLDKSKTSTTETKSASSLQSSQNKVASFTAVKVWTHNSLPFLKPDKIRDANKNKMDHPDYDNRTLYVPEEFLNSQTPAMRQWWILKSQHYDSVLFFKVGKFYELYHMDAVTAVNHLGLSFMKGEFAHSGFPEIAYGKMASSLIDQNFKVGRIEQTETPEMMAERCRNSKKTSKFDKVVSREVCQVTTKATCIYGAQIVDAKQALPCHMIAISEVHHESGSTFGVCFIDTSIGVFHLGQFNDDKHCSKLLSLFAQHPPGLILTERGSLKPSTAALLKKVIRSIRHDTLARKTQFYSAQQTIDVLAKGCYFRGKNDVFEWPLVFKQFIEDGTPKPEFELALKSLGACVWYLKDSQLDMQILCMQKFEVYLPSDGNAQEVVKRNFMVLDSITMEHLGLLGSTGTLQKTLDYCKTSFGKRLMQDFICRPLCDHHEILKRQEAVQELYNDRELRQSVRDILKKIPDLERQISKIHTFGNKYCAQTHPDSRAILYEAKTYSKTKIHDLLSTLKGFEKSQELVSLFTDCKSSLLKKITQHPPQGEFVDLSSSLEFFGKAFDQKQAETQGKIIPKKGVDNDYDEAEQAIVDLQEEINEHLKEQERFFGCKLSYFGTDKKRFQLEVPENKTNKVTEDYKMEGSKKGAKPAKRYTTPTTRKFLADMMKAEERRDKIVKDLNRRIFEKFGDRHEEWSQSIKCLMLLDVLCAFAEYGNSVSHRICFPTVLPFQDESVINIEEGVHPSTLLEDFVPNNTKLGFDNFPKIMLLSGPNMGGKSTLMRQVALIIILAQMGCPVPAASCTLSLVDRIFTRIGASDDILRGQSTFLVELSEASTILKGATHYSFVLIDELGRGTSTHDGNAIATAYVTKLTKIKCRTIFSTHYHSLIDQFINKDNIQLAHMACMTETNEKEVDQELPSVTLLYQLSAGRCPKSYGFSAAQLAGLPKSIIKDAFQVALHQEKIAKSRKLLRKLLLCNDIFTIRSIMNDIRSIV